MSILRLTKWLIFLFAVRCAAVFNPSTPPLPARVETQSSINDVFSRLTGSALRDDIEGDQDPDGVLIRGDQWTLDALGNWDTRLTDPSDLPGDEYSERRSTDNRNRIVGLDYDPQQPTSPAGHAAGDPDAFAYDAAGNLVFDGTYLYQFDAWNRIVQINRAEYATANRPTGPPDNPGEIEPIDSNDLVVGPLVKHFTYDGLGRLIRSQSPIPDPQTAITFNIPLPLRSERHYYDGIRRISTLTIDPLLPSVLVEGDPEPPGNDPPLDPQGLTLEAEAEQLAEGATLAQSAVAAQPIIIELPESLATLREWVWGPGDAYPGIDELLVQFDPQRRPIYIAQDASGDVVAGFDLGGTALQSGDLNGAAFPGGGSGNPAIPESLFTARRVWQASYDPYGQVIAARTEHAHDPVWAGHKGLFVERLDAGVMDGLPGLPTGLGGGSGIDLPRLEPGSTLIAHARNRWLLTRWGIWGSMDPNASGQGVVAASRHGAKPILADAFFDLQALYRDDSNLSAHVGANPFGVSDPLGLSWVEDYDGVILPLIEIVDETVGRGTIGALNEILQGYQLLAWVHSFVQDAAFTAEEELDWALDWSAPDEANPRFGGGVGSSDSSASGGGGPALWEYNAVGGGGRTRSARPGINRGIGLDAEDRILGPRGAKTTVKRETKIADYYKDGKHYKGGGRFYDGERGRTRMEVKSTNGTFRLTGRTTRQADKDAAYLRQNPDQKVRWIIELRGSNAKADQHAINELISRGIEVEIIRHP